MITKLNRSAGLALALLAWAPVALAQAVPPPATLSQDNPPPATTPVAPPAPPVLSGLPRPPLIAQAGDPVDVDDVVIPEKPAIVATGMSTWDEGFVNLRAAFRRLEEAAIKAGIRPAGRPMTIFVQTDDTSFQYQAMIPIDQVPEGQPPLPPGMRIGVTPSGRAYRFVHKGSYDDIDSTYETITTYLDAKNVAAKDAFIEEYANDPVDSADPSLEMNIFVQPK